MIIALGPIFVPLMTCFLKQYETNQEGQVGRGGRKGRGSCREGRFRNVLAFFWLFGLFLANFWIFWNFSRSRNIGGAYRVRDRLYLKCFANSFPSPAGSNCPFLCSFLCHLWSK
jgi:hypothetical protein